MVKSEIIKADVWPQHFPSSPSESISQYGQVVSCPSLEGKSWSAPLSDFFDLHNNCISSIEKVPLFSISKHPSTQTYGVVALEWKLLVMVQCNAMQKWKNPPILIPNNSQQRGISSYLSHPWYKCVAVVDVRRFKLVLCDHNLSLIHIGYMCFM